MIGAFLWTAALGAVSGAISLLVFRRYANGDNLRLNVNLVVAHLMEIQLFAEEPRLVIRAQWELLKANGRILLQLVWPTLILIIPFTMLSSVADSFLGHAPLRPGETALVTVRLRDLERDVRLTVPAGIEVDSPSIYIPSEHQLVWRVRASRNAVGELEILTPVTTVRKQIAAAQGLAWAPASRDASFTGGEWPLMNRAIESIHVGYRPTTIFHLHWLIWFSLWSLVGGGILALVIV